MDLSHITSDNFQVAVDFANRIVRRKQKANKEQIQACQRFLNDLERDDLIFKQEQFDFAIGIIEKTLTHQQGEDKQGVPFKGRPVLLQPWQIFVVVNLLGFFKSEGVKRFNEALIFLPRKQGKTAFSAALGWALNLVNRMSGSKLYIVANSLKQTMESFSFLNGNLQPNAKELKLRILDNNQEHSISFDWKADGSGFIQAIANVEDKLDSLNCNALILDELHSWKRAGAKKYTLMKNAMKAYRNKLLLGISTAGDVPDGFLAQRLKTLQKVLNGSITDKTYDSYFVYICKADQDEEGNVLNYAGEITTIDDPEVLEMCTPSLDVTVTLDELVDDAAQAMNEPQLRNEYLNKTLNIFTNSMKAYFDIDEFTASDRMYEWTLEDLAKLPITWYGGADLSKMHDLTAAALHGVYKFKQRDGTIKEVDISITHAFFPIVNAQRKANEDGIPLFGWQDDGWLTMSNTQTTLFDDIVRWFVDMRNKGFKIKLVGFDKKFGREFVLKMRQAKFKVQDQAQLHYIKSEGFRHIERKVKNKEYYYLHSDAYEYCVQNVRAIEKSDDMIMYEKLDGDGGVDRIDLFDADVFATCKMLDDLALGSVGQNWLNR